MDVRIKEAAAALDIEVPGWAKRIDIECLDMSDCEACILGQLFDDCYCDAPENLKMDLDGGFRWAFDDNGTEDDWIAAVKERTEAKTIPISSLNGINTFEEFVALRDSLTDREIAVTIKASDARSWVNHVTHPADEAKAVHAALTEALSSDRQRNASVFLCCCDR